MKLKHVLNVDVTMSADLMYSLIRSTIWRLRMVFGSRNRADGALGVRAALEEVYPATRT